MEHLRTRGAALVVALFLLLSVAGVAGAAHVILPAVAAPQAQEQVANEHGDEDEDANEDEDTTQDEDTTEDEDTEAPDEDAAGAQGEHGAIVSAVAQNEACVGGEHNNHGWAVSQVARGLIVPDALTGCPVWVPPVVTETTDATDTDAAASPGKSGEHRQDAANKAKKTKTHGRWANQP